MELSRATQRIEKIDESYGGRLVSLWPKTNSYVAYSITEYESCLVQVEEKPLAEMTKSARTRSFCSSGGGSRSKRSITSTLAQDEFEVNVKEALPQRYPKPKRNETKHWHF
ncbi:conserved hypothetical protein [Trichinella spiralis]|uniref:hypothetical protein n=1 Tax=Trichinella spiralis TaxID=6334 RepID=UPI0001EFB718|nr:conserved hypothetical protein [Trichinella spiralis]